MPEHLESMTSSPGRMLVEAVYDCSPDHRDELEFKEGEMIIVTKKISKDWWVSGVTPILYGHVISVLHIYTRREVTCRMTPAEKGFSPSIMFTRCPVLHWQWYTRAPPLPSHAH